MLIAKFPPESVVNMVQVNKSVNLVPAAKPVVLELTMIDALLETPMFVNTEISGEDTAPLLITKVLSSM